MSDDAHVTRSEVDIAAEPQDVWDAITTRSGSAAWMFPADVEPRVGGAVRLHRAPFGPDADGTVTAWDPPRRFAYDEGTAPVFATEFLIESRGRGSCVVRVVSSLYTDDEGWDDIAEEAGTGWRMSLLVLRSYATHFAGLPSAALDLTMPVAAPPSARAEVGALVAGSLGLDGLTAGSVFRTADGIGGTVDHAGPYFLLLRTDEPYPALFAISSFPMDAATLSVNVAGRLFGPGAEALVARERPRWQDWLSGLTTGINH